MPVKVGSPIIPPDRPALTKRDLRGIHSLAGLGDLCPITFGASDCASRRHQLFRAPDCYCATDDRALRNTCRLACAGKALHLKTSISQRREKVILVSIRITSDHHPIFRQWTLNLLPFPRDRRLGKPCFLVDERRAAAHLRACITRGTRSDRC